MNKRKLRFNAVDAVIIFLIIAVVFAVLYFFVFKNDESIVTDDTTRPIQYTVLVQSIDEHFDDKIAIGQAVTDAIEKKNIGKIVGIQISPTIQTTFDYETGKQTQSEVEGKINVKITIEAKASETDQAFTADGCVIRIGRRYSLMLPEIYCVGYCIDINDNLQN